MDQLDAQLHAMSMFTGRMFLDRQDLANAEQAVKDGLMGNAAAQRDRLQQSHAALLLTARNIVSLLETD